MLVRYLSDIILTILVLLFLWCFTTIYTDVVVLLCFLSLVKFFLTYYLCHLSNSQLKHTTYQKYFMCYDKLQKLKLVPKRQRQPSGLSTMNNQTHWQNLAQNIKEKDKKDTLQNKY